MRRLPLAELVRAQRAPAVAVPGRRRPEDAGTLPTWRPITVAPAARRSTRSSRAASRTPTPCDGWLSPLSSPLSRWPRRRGSGINRRQLLQSAAVAAGTVLLSSPRPVAEPGDVIGYLRRVFPEFSTADWMLGSQLVLPAIPRHLDLIGQLLRDATGRDRAELLGVGARWAEFASWLYQDAGQPQAATGWADRAMTWATEAGDEVMVAYTLTRQADQAADRRDAAAAVGLAQAALRRPIPARVRAVAFQQQAHGHAIAGEEAATSAPSTTRSRRRPRATRGRAATAHRATSRCSERPAGFASATSTRPSARSSGSWPDSRPCIAATVAAISLACRAPTLRSAATPRQATPPPRPATSLGRPAPSASSRC